MTGKPVIEFHGLYKERWNDLIHPSAISHPAKFSHGLIRRIYEYALEQGYITPDSKVLDPFGGVGLGSFYAVNSGLIWLGCELESAFYLNSYKNFALWCERFWCVCDDPEYLNLLRQYATPKLEESPQLTLFSQDEVNPDDLLEQIKAHALASWGKENKGSYCPDCGKLVVAYPVLLKGDSRHLSSIIAEQVDGSIASPPYLETDIGAKEKRDGNKRLAALRKAQAEGKELGRESLRVLEKGLNANTVLNAEPGGYGSTPNQLGNMPAGDLDSIVGSPPYIDSAVRNDADYSQDKIESAKASSKTADRATWGNNAGSSGQSGYGTTDGQLGSLKEGSLDSIVSSPPYANSLDSEKSGIDPGKFKDPYGKTTQALRPTQYGKEDGQLGSLPEGSLDSLISSSPFADSIGSDDPDKRGGIYRDPQFRYHKNMTGSYGASEGQLGTMKDEGFDVSLGSPPFAQAQTGGGISATMRGEGNYNVTTNLPRNLYQPSEQGESDGQLANLPDKGFDLSVSSPSFAGNTGGRGDASRNGIDPALFDRSSGGMKRGTGDSEDNLDHLSMKGFDEVMDASISSPPFEDSISSIKVSDSFWEERERKWGSRVASPRRKDIDAKDYGQSDNQLGNSTGPTFWQAAKDILLECHKLLKPGAYSFWVVKAYVKSGTIVQFPEQWLRLCEVCGFEHVETIIAWQTEDKGTNFDFAGEKQKKVVKRKSFFRILYEKKNPDNAIDSEIVLVMRKVA